MNRSAKKEIFVFLSLIVFGVAARLIVGKEIPNFAPVAAIALFSGYYFRSQWMALAVPICTMAISDHFIGGYDWGMMVAVYGMLALPVAARNILRRKLDLTSVKKWGKSKAICGYLTCSLTASIFFFLVTNFAVWYVWSSRPTSFYAPTLAGLVHCYVQGSAFFKYTLASDLFFGLTLFGGHALLLQLLHGERASITQDTAALAKSS